MHFKFVDILLTKAIVIYIALRARPTLNLCIEQPAQSWGFKQRCMVALISAFSLTTVLTFMGHFQHDMVKATHLLTNLRPDLFSISFVSFARMRDIAQGSHKFAMMIYDGLFDRML